MLETLITAVVAFASSNIDDIFILMTLFTQVSVSLTRHHIMGGQYLGIITLTLLSIAGSLLGIIVPKQYLGLLGFFPIYLGVMKVYHYLKNRSNDNDEVDINPVKERSGWLSMVVGVQALNIAAITIANGGDNIGIYVPLFANQSWKELALTVTIFMILVYVWVTVASYATRHPLLTKNLKEAITRRLSFAMEFLK